MGENKVFSGRITLTIWHPVHKTGLESLFQNIKKKSLQIDQGLKCENSNYKNLEDSLRYFFFLVLSREGFLKHLRTTNSKQNY